jgi:hypothetical protein
MTFREYPTEKIVAWLDAVKWRVPSRRAWSRFTNWALVKYGDFSEMSAGGGFSGAPKLQATIAVLERLKGTGELGRVQTVGDCLVLARHEGWALGFLPPVDHATKIAKLAGRHDIAERLAAAGL